MIFSKTFSCITESRLLSIPSFKLGQNLCKPSVIAFPLIINLTTEKSVASIEILFECVSTNCNCEKVWEECQAAIFGKFMSQALQGHLGLVLWRLRIWQAQNKWGMTRPGNTHMSRFTAIAPQEAQLDLSCSSANCHYMSIWEGYAITIRHVSV